MYNPLPAFLTIGRSGIHGLGLFATEDIPVNIDLGMSHLEVDGVIIRTPLGGFYNHSESPNCRREKIGEKQWNLYTIKDIKAGEELTATYGFYDPR